MSKPTKAAKPAASKGATCASASTSKQPRAAAKAPSTARRKVAPKGTSGGPQRAAAKPVKQASRTEGKGAAPAQAAEEGLLSDLEAGFVAEYMVDQNGAQAYQRTRPGVKVNSAASEASRLLRLPKVAGAIGVGLAEMSKRAMVTADQDLGWP